MENINIKRIMKIAIPVCICAAVLIVLAAVLFAGNDSKTSREYYDLGMQYLEEGNYQEAIVAFTSAIELDDRQSVVYIGRGDAYTGLAQEAEKRKDWKEAEDMYGKAADDYEQAVELGDEEEAWEKLERTEAALEAVAEQIALEEESDLLNEDEMTEETDGEEADTMTQQPSDTDDEETNTTSDRNNTSQNRPSTNNNTSANTSSNNRPAQNTGNQSNNSGNMSDNGNDTGAADPAPAEDINGNSELQTMVNSYLNTFFDKTINEDRKSVV